MFRRLIFSVVVVGVVSMTAIALAALPPGGSFSDDNGNIHEPNIEAIAAEGITKGCNPPANTQYCPDESVSRGEMAAFLRRSLNLPASSVDYFDDDDDSVFEGDINALAAAGVTKGCNPPANTEYCPDTAVTRGQMAAFLDRAFGYPGSPDDYFIDDNASIFEPNINAIARAGVTRGCDPPDNTRYCPSEPVERDQMASFLSRALHLDPIAPPPPDPLALPPPADDWLAALNWYRAWSGLEPAKEDTGLSEDIAAHLRYLELTPDSYFTGTYGNLHTENPSSPYYSPSGARAGLRSNLGWGNTDLDAIEGWMTAPFHAAGLLEPGLRTTGFARGVDALAHRGGMNSGLDVISGLVPVQSRDVFFPGPGARISLTEFSGEKPDPTEPCTFKSSESPFGLPIYAFLSFPPTEATTAHLTYPNGTTISGDGPRSRLCVLTEHNAFSSDPLYSYAIEKYRQHNMVLVFPDEPLTAGDYRIEMETAGRTHRWSFSVIAGSS